MIDTKDAMEALKMIMDHSDSELEELKASQRAAVYTMAKIMMAHSDNWWDKKVFFAGAENNINEAIKFLHIEESKNARK